MKKYKDACWHDAETVQINSVQEISSSLIVSTIKKAISGPVKKITHGKESRGNTLNFQVYCKDNSFDSDFRWRGVTIEFNFPYSVIIKAKEEKSFGIGKLYSELKSKLKTYENKDIYEDRTLKTDSLKKYKIGKYVVDAKDPAHAVELIKILKSKCKDSSFEHLYQAQGSLDEENKYWTKRFGNKVKSVKKVNYAYDNMSVTFQGNKSDLIRIAKSLGYDDRDLKDLIEDSVQKGEIIKRRDSVKDGHGIFSSGQWFKIQNYAQKYDENADKIAKAIEKRHDKYPRMTIDQCMEDVFDELVSKGSIYDSVDYSYLNEEEQKAVDDYRKAIQETQNPEVLKIFSHILQEELDHIEELKRAESIDDAKMNSYRVSSIDGVEHIDAVSESEAVKKYQQKHPDTELDDIRIQLILPYERNQNDSVKDFGEKYEMVSFEKATSFLKSKGIDYDNIKTAAGTEDVHFFKGSIKVAIYSPERKALYLV